MIRDRLNRAVSLYRERVPQSVRKGVRWPFLIAAVVVGFSYGISLNPGISHSGELAEACSEEFGDEWGNSGWITGNPPVIQCKHPNGSRAMMDMPKRLAKDRGIVAADYDRVEQGQMDLSGLPINESAGYGDRDEP